MNTLTVSKLMVVLAYLPADTEVVLDTDYGVMAVGSIRRLQGDGDVMLSTETEDPASPGVIWTDENK